ncbi:MAG: OmpH family outer membrane protein [Rhizomicrobium sp.]
MTNIASRPALAAAGFVLGIVLALSASAVAQGQSHPAPAAMGIPAPKILVIDRQALLRASNVGQDIARQVKALTKTAEAELKGEGEALSREKQALEQQVAILAPDVKAQKIRAFEQKAAAFQQKAQQKNLQIRYGVALAQRQVESVAGPIVQGIMQERGANLLIDRQAIVIGAPGLDVTKVAVDRLNQKLPAVKVQLVSPPPEVLQQMQQQQQ